MNKYFIIALIALLCSANALHAQDIIVLKNGSELRAIVLRITSTEVKFKMYHDSSEATYGMENAKISMIKYEDGTKYIFRNEQPAQPQYKEQPQQHREYREQPPRQEEQPQRYKQYREEEPQQYKNYSQYKKSSSWRKFNAGISFPDFNISFPDFDDYLVGFSISQIYKLDELSDAAGNGLGIGLKSYRSLETLSTNLSFGVGAEFYYHGLSSDIKEKVEDKSSSDVTYPMFFNLPITISGNYTVPLPNTNTSIYGEAAIGLNISYITKTSAETTNNAYEYKEELSFDIASGFCYGFEGGIIFNDKVYIGVKYNNLGTYKYKYEYKFESYYGAKKKDTDTYKGKTGKCELSNTVLVLGIKF